MKLSEHRLAFTARCGVSRTESTACSPARHNPAHARHHHGRRRGHAAISLTKDRSKPAVPLGGEISAGRYPDQQLPQLRAALDLRAHPVQQHVAASPYPGELQVRQFFPQLRRHSRRAANPEGSQWYQGTADAVRQNLRYFLEQPVRLLPHPERRSALPDGFSDTLASAHSFRRRDHARRQLPCSAPRLRTSASC